MPRGLPAWGPGTLFTCTLLRELLWQPCPSEGPPGPHVQAVLHVVQSWSTGAVSATSPSRPIKPRRGQSLPRSWHLWGICVVGGATSLDLHSLVPLGLKSHGVAMPIPLHQSQTHTHTETHRYTQTDTRAQRDIHRHRYTQRHMATHTDTHNAVGVPSFPLSPERVYKDSLSCLGPLGPGGQWFRSLPGQLWAAWPRQCFGGSCLTPVASLSLFLRRQHREHSYRQ